MKTHREAGLFGASVAIGAMATAGISWGPVLAGWALGTLLLLVLPSRGAVQSRGSALALLIGGILVMAAAALGAEDAFPEDGTFPFVSAALLLLLWRAMCGERRTPGDVANLLGMFLLAVLGTVTVFGLQNVRWEEVKAPGWSWRQALIALAATSPWWGLRQGEKTRRMWLWYGASGVLCLSFSLLTWGILGGGLTPLERFPLYRAVQTIRILGTLQRLEALLAASVLMGAFCVMLLTGQRTNQALDCLLPNWKRKWKSGAVILVAFLVEWGFRLLPEVAAAAGETVFWVVIPILVLVVVLSKKSEKSRKKD